jgi:hypothetical protein
VKSLNAVVMIVCLLRCFLLHFLQDCYHLYFCSCFAVRLSGPLPLISMMVSLSSGLCIFWDTILLLHFIVLHRIILNHCIGRTRGKACLLQASLCPLLRNPRERATAHHSVAQGRCAAISPPTSPSTLGAPSRSTSNEGKRRTAVLGIVPYTNPMQPGELCPNFAPTPCC